MATLAMPFSRVVLWVLAILLTTPKAFGSPPRVCFDNHEIQTGTFISEKQLGRMLSDATFPKNQNIPKNEKVQRVIASIQYSHQGLDIISDKKLGELIVEVADCSGNDFSIFAGLLKKESDYCLNRRNTSSRRSSASGCGQFTIWPIREFKNHLALPGRTKMGFPHSRTGIETLLNRCLSKDEIKDFIQLFSLSTGEVKAFLSAGSNIKLDLVASAIFLKFYYGKRGFYYNPHSSTPGALSEYGEGSGYAGLVKKFSGNINYTCVDDTEYIEEIEEISCELSDDPASCYLTTPTYEI